MTLHTFTLKEIALMLLPQTAPRERSRWFGPLAVGAVLLALGSAPAGAQTAVLYGCYVPSSGTVYRIKEAGLPDACRSQQHVQFTWGLQGPAGPAGPQGLQGPAGGLSGYQVVVAPINAPVGVLIGHAADCPAGKRVTGGGFFAESARTGVQWIVVSSRPGTDPFNPTVWSRWGVEARHNATSEQTLVVYAVCAAVN